MKEVISWYIQNKNLIDLTKDVVFAIGASATFVSFYKLIRFFLQRTMINKRQEMDNDSQLYKKIHKKLTDYVNSYGLEPNQIRGVGIRLQYIKNYPYKLNRDGFPQALYYYFYAEHHQPSGYISGKGLYVVDFIYYFGNSIYHNPDTDKWFIDVKGHKFRKYRELEQRYLVKRIPFANILGCDFDSD